MISLYDMQEESASQSHVYSWVHFYRAGRKTATIMHMLREIEGGILDRKCTVPVISVSVNNFLAAG